MTALDHPTHAIDARTRVGALVERVANGLRAFLRALVNRRELVHLGEMSDRQLADIGLTRADLFVATRAPLGVDPTARLGASARQRHAAEGRARRVH